MVHEIYLAEDINGLNKFAELNANIGKKPVEQLCKSTKAVLQEAEQRRRAGDHENAYIFYMKYFNLISIIQKSRDFDSKVRKRSKELLGSRDEINTRLTILENLKDSLSKRYAEKQEKQKHKRELEEHKENVQARNANATNINQSSDIFIACSQLHKQLSNSNETILLIDCRSEKDFQESKIRFTKQINIPEDIIKKGLTASMLTSRIPQSARSLWVDRGKMDSIVLIDEETKKQQGTNDSKPIWIMRGILMEWDPDYTYKSILILDGGYDNFVVAYPMATTNSKYSRKMKDETPLYPSLDGIEYPSFGDIKMKPKETEKPKYIPRIDRTNKPNSGQKSLDTQPLINPVALAREKEMVIDQILQKEKEVINIGNELSRMVDSRIPSESDLTEWYNKQTELEYKFIQKENELNDTISELQSVSQHEFETKLENLQVENQNPEMVAIQARIETKEKEYSQTEKWRKENRQAIEEKMNVWKEKQKRHLQLKEEEEDLVRPKMPAIDRSSKPTFDRMEKFPQIHRDFSPVYGSYGDFGATGLKNLGNTCYMNSIIQCLLNLDTFCQYLKSDLYLRYINRKSQTRGQVTEELAQLCKEMWTGKYKSVAALDLRSVIGQHHKIFASYDQQDSHEFLVILIDMLNSELQFPMSDPIVQGKINKSDMAWREFVKNMQSIIQELFFGQIRSTLKCRTCEHESATYEGFSHLSLELPQSNKQCRLYDCLDLYFDGEIIDGWTCPECKQSREAVKKLDISRLPPVLVIHLKRFYASMNSSNTYEKKQNYVYFPINDFNIADYVTPSLKQRQQLGLYNLFAVSNHYGTMNRGHYTAFCKNAISKQWYKFDDSYVTQIASDDVNSSAGYILFYTSL